MKVALFLDVDKTLTIDWIQHGYAILLGCEDEYKTIESDFQRKAITSKVFGERLIALFRSKNFKKSFAEEKWGRIALQSYAEQLLNTLPDVDKYLVSSGPDYYIDNLADHNGIPIGNVCRSRYYFGEDGLIESCDAINEQQKAKFVQERASQYDVSVGIGDSPEFDGPFVSHCTIPLLTVPTESVFHVESFAAVMTLLEKLSVTKGSSASHEATPRNEAVVAEGLSVIELAKRLALSSWLVLFGIIAAAFTLGLNFENLRNILRTWLQAP
jgi:phosphoserine phosphatase